MPVCRYSTNNRTMVYRRLTVLPRMNAAVAPRVAPIESAANPTGNPKR